SPGSSWNRELRRRGGWVASCINGDPKRGVGILNSEMYVGRVVWNRSRWIRGAADSKKRRQVQNPKSAWIVRDEPARRIVPQALWDRVKARRARQAAQFGARVKRGMPRASAGPTGRLPQYLFSGLLVCGQVRIQVHHRQQAHLRLRVLDQRAGVLEPDLCPPRSGRAVTARAGKGR